MLCVFVRERVFDVGRHSHLQDSLELLEFRFLLLDLAVVVLAQFNQQQAGDIQHFLETSQIILNLTLVFHFSLQTKHTLESLQMS